MGQTPGVKGAKHRKKSNGLKEGTQILEDGKKPKKKIG